MKPLHHHLYQIIKRACEVYKGKCTFAKKTFCRITGYAPSSDKYIRKAMPVLEKAGLVEVERKQKGWVITLCDNHEDVYTAILNKECFRAFDEAEEDEKQEMVLNLDTEEARDMVRAFKNFKI